MLKQISSAEIIVATRFHAHIFGLINNTNIYSMAYAFKCRDLYERLVGNKKCFEPVQWVNNKKEIINEFDDFINRQDSNNSFQRNFREDIINKLDRVFGFN